MAVIIQKMIDSEKSGIAFSVHPVTQNKNQIIIEAGFGLGEAIVSGSITPDDYLVDKQGFNILNINVNEQTKALYKKVNGGNKWEKLKEKGKQKVLLEKEIIELSKLIVKIEKHYNFPCDIEWAKKGKKFYILQSRPITTITNKKYVNNDWHKKYNFIINEKWEQIVGRKSPVLRSSLIYEGFHKWFQKRFNFKLTCCFITFSKYEKGNISSDNFINLKVRKQILKHIEESIEFDYQKIIKDIDVFNKNCDELVKSSKELSNKKVSLNKRFDTFCRIWKKFSSTLIMPLFLEKYLERIILNDFQDKEIAHKKLMEIISEGVQSELFEIKISSKKRKANYFKPSHEKYINLLKKLINTRDKRKNSYEKAWNEYSVCFFDELKKVTKLHNKIFWISHNILNELLNHKSKKKRYYNESLVYFIDGKVHVEYTQSFDWLKNKILKIDSNKNMIKGNIAYQGKVKGIVKIIIPNDSKNIKCGQILVTKMTTPDYVPIMKKASAFITDEGGVTCHAAIISREMKKPCIIGTKIATKILKNGDLVEVDANQGIVNILKKSKK